MAKQRLNRAQLINGLVKQRQGGTTGVADWSTTGTSNTDTSITNAFIQVGSIATLPSSGADLRVNFPVAFTNAPIVLATIGSANASNQFCTVNTISTTGFNIRQVTGASSEIAFWVAIGA